MIAPSGRVIGGIEAAPNKFPFICALARQTETGLRNTCAVSILTENWFLTAAHCVMVQAWIADLKIYCGLHDLSDVNKNVQIRSLDHVVLHEGWEYTDNNQSVWFDVSVVCYKNQICFLFRFFKFLIIYFRFIRKLL